MTAVSGSTARDPVAETALGPVRGTDDGVVRVFRGLRYAAAPTGALRWRAPEPPPPWTEVVDATGHGPICPQPNSPIPLGAGTRSAEDCLFLNVSAPSGTTAGAGLPVLVWVHGGAYIFGSGSQPLYDARALVAGAGESGDGSGVIVVTLNYRMGALGFLELGEFSSGTRKFDSNLGLRDVLQALEWVRDNIAAFGGDPDRVTLSGESAGGCITATLLASPAAAGLFSRAIVQSAPVTSVYAIERAHRVARLLLDRLDATATEAAGLPVQALVDASLQIFDHIPSSTPGTMAFSPIIDGDLVPDHPVAAARAGRTHPVPLLIGTNRDEASMFRYLRSPVLPIAAKAQRTMFETLATEQPGVRLPSAEQVSAAYAGIRARARGLHIARDVGFRMPTLWLADGHHRVAPVHLYRFDWATPMFRLLRLGASHAAELPYVWGNLVGGPRDITFKLGGLEHGRTISRRMRARWLNFVRGADPDALAGDPAWPGYTAAERASLVIDRHDSVRADPDRRIRAAWGDDVIGFR